MIKKFIVLITIILISFSLLGCQKEIENYKEETNNSLKEYNYSFNPHVISKEFSLIYGNDIEENFFDFCDAILNKEKTFKCQSNEYFHILLSISNSCFPLANELIDKNKTYVDNGICYLTYVYEDNELDNKINEFKERINNVINEVIKYETKDYIKAIELYTFMSQKNKYDYDYTLDDALKIKSYRSIMDNIGICQEFSGEYIYYLLQVGINGITCSALNNDNSEAHEWVLINLDDKYYHVDVTYSLNYPDSLFFFALDDKQREYYGDFNKNDFTYADNNVLKYDDYKADDRRFEKFWLAKSYKIDYINETITIIDNNTSQEITYQFDE